MTVERTNKTPSSWLPYGDHCHKLEVVELTSPSVAVMYGASGVSGDTTNVEMVGITPRVGGRVVGRAEENMNRRWWMTSNNLHQTTSKHPPPITTNHKLTVQCVSNARNQMNIHSDWIHKQHYLLQPRWTSPTPLRPSSYSLQLVHVQKRIESSFTPPFVLFCFVLFCFVLFLFDLFVLFLFCFVFVLFCFVLFLFCFVLFCFVCWDKGEIDKGKSARVQEKTRNLSSTNHTILWPKPHQHNISTYQQLNSTISTIVDQWIKNSFNYQETCTISKSAQTKRERKMQNKTSELKRIKIKYRNLERTGKNKAQQTVGRLFSQVRFWGCSRERERASEELWCWRLNIVSSSKKKAFSSLTLELEGSQNLHTTRNCGRLWLLENALAISEFVLYIFFSFN